MKYLEKKRTRILYIAYVTEFEFPCQLKVQLFISDLIVSILLQRLSQSSHSREIHVKFRNRNWWDFTNVDSFLISRLELLVKKIKSINSKFSKMYSFVVDSKCLEVSFLIFKKPNPFELYIWKISKTTYFENFQIQKNTSKNMTRWLVKLTSP